MLRTERGIKYLGRRLGDFVLEEVGWNSQTNSFSEEGPLYSKISFIGHSLGGCVQMFAIAYVHMVTNKAFFELIKPINFITLASPFLGIGSENPNYVKLALTFGVVGKTGWDMGLTWRPVQTFETAETLAQGGINSKKKESFRDPRPLLRLLALPSSPAHEAIKAFQNHTIYANMINDGIVPLRTAALFFLDWNSIELKDDSEGSSNNLLDYFPSLSIFSKSESKSAKSNSEPTSPSENNGQPLSSQTTNQTNETTEPDKAPDDSQNDQVSDTRRESNATNTHSNANPMLSFLALIRPQAGKTRFNASKVWPRTQTIQTNMPTGHISPDSSSSSPSSPIQLPPRRSVIENLTDLVTPPLPSDDFIKNPSSRPNVIIHDKVYHPADIPPMSLERKESLESSSPEDPGVMKSLSSKSAKEKLRMEEKNCP